ncbi:MAG TPA: GNAT family N-acetyltransferase, partial [Candidatus Tetragenococcus pullicola]|nr:GNAT family N-acetyltransferase [Candidatus Tetragenococcus pullicola]
MLREATIKDRQAIAELVYVILTDMQLPFLKGKTKEQTVNLLAETITDPTYRYGYKRGIVEDIEGTVAGIAFGYRSFDEEVIDRPFSKTLQAHGLLNERLFTDPEC